MSRLRPLAPVALLALVLAGCGDGGPMELRVEESVASAVSSHMAALPTCAEVRAQVQPGAVLPADFDGSCRDQDGRPSTELVAFPCDDGRTFLAGAEAEGIAGEPLVAKPAPDLGCLG